MPTPIPTLKAASFVKKNSVTFTMKILQQQQKAVKALYDHQKMVRSKMKRKETLNPGSSDFLRVEKFLRRHPKHKLGKITAIFADFGNPYDNCSRKKNLCWWVRHDLSSDPVMIGQEACRRPEKYLEKKRKEAEGEILEFSIKRAMRISVRGQIEEFRNSCQPGIVCPVTEKEINILGESEVDHDKPEFAELVKLFREKYPELNYKVHKPNGMCEIFECDETEKTWTQYHRKNANLRLLSKEGHKKKTAEQRKPRNS